MNAKFGAGINGTHAYRYRKPEAKSLGRSKVKSSLRVYINNKRTCNRRGSLWNVECAPEASSGGRGGGRELGGDGGKDPDDEVTRHICADLGRSEVPTQRDRPSQSVTLYVTV